MHVLFEEAGAFRCGDIVADNEASLQVDSVSGKRVKIKSAQVLLRFAAPAAAALLPAAEAAAAAMDVEFLWDVCGDAEFSFVDFAAEYFGRRPAPEEAAAVLLCLHAAPIYFHRKGKGRFRKAPPEILQAALAGQEKKRQQALAIERMKQQLLAGELPPELAPLLPQLLYKPDRNRGETKALEAACAESGETPQAIMLRCGAIADSHAWRLGAFLHEFHPQHTDLSQPPPFPPYAPPQQDFAALPTAAVQAFSIDDAATTEIDDAFSVQMRGDGGMCVGIHIAAPGLGFTADSDLGGIARARLSTVYMPGDKITMLPSPVVDAFTLAAGAPAPTLSLYLEVDATGAVIASESRIERLTTVANLHRHDIEPRFNAALAATGDDDFPWAQQLLALHRLAVVLAAKRGDSGQNDRKEYTFDVDWTQSTQQGRGRVSICERPRGSPLDQLVAELMIIANNIWGEKLRDAGVIGMYRAQSSGKARMTSAAAPHEGLGVSCYAWCTSPLRRYADLVNQWQVIACLRDEAPPFAPRSQQLQAAMRDFELTSAAYAEFQRDMERYWCLRWLLQEGVSTASAVVVKENLVRLENLPLLLRVDGMPTLERAARVRVAISAIDLLSDKVRAECIEVCAAAAPPSAHADRGEARE